MDHRNADILADLVVPKIDTLYPIYGKSLSNGVDIDIMTFFIKFFLSLLVTFYCSDLITAGATIES